MADLSKTLHALGITHPNTSAPRPQTLPETPWTDGQSFAPIAGSSYEVGFGKILYKGEQLFATARLRIEGANPATWIDLDNNTPLDPDLRLQVVKRFRAA
jgi:hypothetical protein